MGKELPRFFIPLEKIFHHTFILEDELDQKAGFHGKKSSSQ